MCLRLSQKGKELLESRERGRRLDGVENDLKIMGVRGWRKTARDIDAWKVILNVARVLHGP